MEQILEILEKDARSTPEEISKMTGTPAADIRKCIADYEKSGIILKYKTIINKDKAVTAQRTVRALIEVKVAPEKDKGFDSVARRVYQYPEVTSCYLLSGGYDLLLTVEGKDILTIATFVAEKLSPMENVRSTVTHFLLKKYKEDGDILESPEEDKRIPISL
jgi:DNA-binding Lrp family transcriptional regulator